MKLFDEELAQLASLLMTYAEVYPDEQAAELRVKVLQHFKEQTGNSDIRPYITNTRNAGRKQTITEEQKEQIKQARKDGMKLQDIAREFNISLGSVHRVLNPYAYK